MNFENEDRQIDPSLVLGDDTEAITFDKVLTLLGMHYWWNGNAISPDDTAFEEMLGDASDAQIAKVAAVLHAGLPAFAPDDYGCQMTAGDCLEAYIASSTDGSERTRLVERTKTFEWLDLLGAGDILHRDVEEPSPLLRAYQEFVPRKLLAAGATELEADWALEVLAREEFRRDERSPDVEEAYAQHLMAGGTYESFVSEVVPALFSGPELFESVCEEYKGLPDDVLGWPIDRRRALVKRYFNENPELLEYARITHELEHNGVLPEYLRRHSDWS